MKKRNKILIRFLMILGIITLMVVIALIRNPLLRTEEGIRNYLLRITPIGTSMEEVIGVIDNHEKWSIRFISEDSGVSLHPTVIPESSSRGLYNNPLFPNNIIGERSLRVYLGNYSLITRVYVDAFYAFDEDGKLIEILVWKVWDLL